MDVALLTSLGGLMKLIGIALLPLFLIPLITLIAPGLTARLASTLTRSIDRATSGVMAIAMASVVILVLAQLLVVFLRYAFGLSFTWLNEIVIYAFATTFMLGAAAALRDDAHVRVDIMRPSLGEDGRNWVELAGLYLLLFPICVRLLVAQTEGLSVSWRLFEGSRESDGLPLIFLFKTLLPAFCVLLLMQGLSEACKAALRLTGRLAPAAHSPEAPLGT